MRDSWGCKRFAHGELQACLLWVVSSECFEAGFAFRKAAIILLQLQMSLPCCCAGEGWHSVSWDCGYQALELHRPELSPGFLQVPVQVMFFIYLFVCFPKRIAPKQVRQGANANMFFLAPVRPKDLSLLQREGASEGCGTCWGVLQQGDLHSFWQKGIVCSKPKWDQNHPLFPALLPSQSAGNFSVCSSGDIGEVEGNGLLNTETPHSAQAAPELGKAEAGETLGTIPCILPHHLCLAVLSSRLDLFPRPVQALSCSPQLQELSSCSLAGRDQGGWCLPQDQKNQLLTFICNKLFKDWPQCTELHTGWRPLFLFWSVDGRFLYIYPF